jgi:hypothetical protein
MFQSFLDKPPLSVVLVDGNHPVTVSTPHVSLMGDGQLYLLICILLLLLGKNNYVLNHFFQKFISLDIYLGRFSFRIWRSCNEFFFKWYMNESVVELSVKEHSNISHSQAETFELGKGGEGKGSNGFNSVSDVFKESC